MKRKKSQEYFRTKPEYLNCAQCILKAFRKEFNIEERMIKENKVNGGGRSEGGICGALLAAKQLLDPARYLKLEKEFIAEMGTTYCKELKKAGKDCRDNVILVDKLVEGSLDALDDNK